MRKRIFVVDDNALTVAQLEQYIEEMGYQFVGSASNAADALAQVAQQNPDLVLMDIRLDGEMDGIEAATRLQADSAAVVIYLTAYSDEETLARAKLTEPFAYLLKPFTKQDLKACIEIGLYKSEMQIKTVEQLDELQRWYKVMQGREMRILELKREVNELLKSSGSPPRYGSVLKYETTP